LFTLIARHQSDLKIISIVFDKRYFGDKKRSSLEGNPLVKTSQTLFKRLQYLGNKNLIIFDQMESSFKVTSGKHRLILSVLENKEKIGEIFVDNYTSIANIEFAKSSRENFLQMADICGYPIYRQFVHYGRQWCSPKIEQLKMYEYFDKIRHNFVDKNTKVRGVGLVCLPDIEKVNWNILGDGHIL